MKKLISLLSLALVLTMLACCFVGCAPKSNMYDLAKAIVDGKVDQSLINVENIQGTKYGTNTYYDQSGIYDYTEHSYKLEGRDGSYIGAKSSAKLDQTITDIEIKGGTEAKDYDDYVKVYQKSNLVWSFDSVDEYGDSIYGYVKFETVNVPGVPNDYFYVQYTLYEIEPFTTNVDSEEPYFTADDLKNIMLDYYDGEEGEFAWDDLNEAEKLLLLTTINKDLAQLVKTCKDAGYPAQSR